MNLKDTNSCSSILKGLGLSLLAVTVIYLSNALFMVAPAFADASRGKPLGLRSFINIFHLDVDRSSFREGAQLQAAETMILTFRIDPTECILYPAPEGYDYLKVADLKPAARPGAPQLPMKTFVVELDKSMQVYGVEVIDGLAREVDGQWNIIPAPEPSVWESGGEGGRHIPDQAIYGLNRPFPGKLVSYDTGADNKRQYVFVRLFPVQYTPSQKKVLVLTEATLKLYYGPGSAAPPGKGGSGPSPTGFPFGDPGVDLTDKECVIICPGLFNDPNNLNFPNIAQQLQGIHAIQGIGSEIVTTEYIDANCPLADHPPFSGYKNSKLRGWRKISNYNYDLARKIIWFLWYVVNNYSNVEYVTIIGDSGHVPPSYYYSEGGMSYSSWIPSDALYGSPDYDVDPSLYPNFGVGRLSVSTDAEAAAMVSKIESWYLTVHWGWFKRVYLTGGNPHASQHYCCAELNLTGAVNNGYFGGMDITKLFHTDLNYTKANVESALNGVANVGILYHLDHGSGSSISIDSESITADEVIGYSAPSPLYIPVVFSVSCDNGAFDLDVVPRNCENSFGEVVIKSGAGGIAYIGGSRHNTGDAIWYYEQGNLVVDYTTYMIQLFNHALSSYHSGEDTLGYICYDALAEYITWNPISGNNADPIDVATVFRHVLLGDPTLKVPVQSPVIEYEKPLCAASLTENFAYYDEESIPVYNAAPVDFEAITLSPSVKWKLIDVNLDISRDLSTIQNGGAYTYTSNWSDDSLYLLRTAAWAISPGTGFAAENWLYFRIQSDSSGAGEMHVSTIDMSLRTKGASKNAVAEVTIADESGSPVSGATVLGEWIWDNGTTIVTYENSGVTRGKGKATLSSDPVGKNESGTFDFCVKGVTLESWTYNPGADVETCDNISTTP